jgi:DnaJ like chaperone protein
MKYGKLLGGVLGWAMLGPIGGLLGFAIGSVIDNATMDVTVMGNDDQPPVRTRSGDFMASLLILSAAVMKADNKVLKSEVDYVKTFLLKQFGPEKTTEQMLILRDLLEKHIPLNEVCAQIRMYMDMSSRLQLIHYLFGISLSDGQAHDQEIEVIKTIAFSLGINPSDFNSIKAMFVKDTNADYKILEVTPEVSDEELKKAYRKMAVKFHPDKVSHLGEDVQQSAKEKFQRVAQAYENIKKTRGIN